jgi:hypothetical protein
MHPMAALLLHGPVHMIPYAAWLPCCLAQHQHMHPVAAVLPPSLTQLSWDSIKPCIPQEHRCHFKAHISFVSRKARTFLRASSFLTPCWPLHSCRALLVKVLIKSSIHKSGDHREGYRPNPPIISNFVNGFLEELSQAAPGNYPMASLRFGSGYTLLLCILDEIQV